jgi:aminoglycoside 2''-phosphotransferase
MSKYQRRVRAICPDMRIEKAVFNGEGLTNDVLIVNNRLVFRFAKDDYGIRALATETRILDCIRPVVPLPIPEPFYRGSDVIAYPLVPGLTLSRERLVVLPESSQRAIADQLAHFLHALHHVPLDDSFPTTTAPVHDEAWVRIRQDVEAAVYPLLLPHQGHWAKELFASALEQPSTFQYVPRLIHGDLGCYHILFDHHAQRLSGIIDFGVAGVGDPAMDLACLLQYYGAVFVNRLEARYPELPQYLKRARFYAQALELEWVLAGLKSGEPLGFTAHLGGARSITL